MKLYPPARRAALHHPAWRPCRSIRRCGDLHRSVPLRFEGPLLVRCCGSINGAICTLSRGGPPVGRAGEETKISIVTARKDVSTCPIRTARAPGCGTYSKNPSGDAERRENGCRGGRQPRPPYLSEVHSERPASVRKTCRRTALGCGPRRWRPIEAIYTKSARNRGRASTSPPTAG
jgi:hypothetical protein